MNNLPTTLPSYTSGTSTVPLIGMTIGDKFDQIAAMYPDNDALIVRHQQIRWTYAELKAQVDTVARALLAVGVRRGDRVGMWSPNNAQWLQTQIATAKIGAILVNINPAYRLHELEYALNQSEARFLVTANSFKSSNYTEMLQTLAPELAHCEPGALESRNLPHLQGIINLSENTYTGMWRWNDFVEKADAIDAEQLADAQRELQFDDPINIQY
ncbi:MAG: AMP-binding protein, partial [Oceanospirillales bacterium]|nr:AMP-binding protein [Oceanospirillales bacterium]